MPLSEPELLVARLARVKALLDALEGEYAGSVETRQQFEHVRRELDAIRERLRIIDVP